ncbi:hypothetical protein PMIN03_004490 [Paraphaeosphaeria minitans]
MEYACITVWPEGTNRLHTLSKSSSSHPLLARSCEVSAGGDYMGRLLFNACGSKLDATRFWFLGTRKMVTLLVTCSPLRFYLQSNHCGEHLLKQVDEWDGMSGVNLGITLRMLPQAVPDFVLSRGGALFESSDGIERGWGPRPRRDAWASSEQPRSVVRRELG